MTLKFRTTHVLVVAGLAATALTGCLDKGGNQQQAATTPQAVQVVVQQVELSDAIIRTDAPGRATAYQTAEVRPQVSGILQKRLFEEGAMVKEGQSLYRIDPALYKAQVASAKASLLQARANLASTKADAKRSAELVKVNAVSRSADDQAQAAYKVAIANVEAARAALGTAELTYKSNKELYAQKVVSEFSLKTAENTYLTAKAQLSQAQAQEVSARNNLSYTEVKSPSDGVVGALPFRVGALVSPGIQQPLTTVSDNSDMYVYFSMTENQLLSLTRQYGSMDEALKNMPEVELRLNDNSIYDEHGIIESISGVIDRQTGTVVARAVFPNESRLLHSGASGNVVIPSVYKDCIIIPQGATVQMQDKTIAYKVVDGKAVSTLISVAGINDGREYVVLDGLKAGDEIISEGAGLIREGTVVK